VEKIRKYKVMLITALIMILPPLHIIEENFAQEIALLGY